MENQDKKQGISLDELEFAERMLRDIKKSNESANHLNKNIFYALVFGVFGNFLVTLLYNLGLKDFSNGFKVTITLILMILLMMVFWKFIWEDKKFTRNNKNLDSEIKRIIEYQDRVKNGEKIDKNLFLRNWQKYIEKPMKKNI